MREEIYKWGVLGTILVAIIALLFLGMTAEGLEKGYRKNMEKQTMHIRPCAYCWSSNVHLTRSPIHDNYYVFCDNPGACMAVGGHFDTKEEAVRKWNEITDCMKYHLSPHSEEFKRACESEEMTHPTYILNQYLPSFVDCERSYKSADTIEEILTAPWVVRWMQNAAFHQLAEIKEEKRCDLIVQLENGYKWYMIGILRRSDDVQPTFGLPEHETKYRDKELKND